MRQLLFVPFLLFAHVAMANDSSAALGAGGLVPRQNTRVIMESEELRITPDRIQVSYVFFNPGKKDDQSIVSFPLPEIKAQEIEQTISALRGTKAADPANLVSFTVEVDGKKISPGIEQRAWLGRRDVTPVLKELGLPIIPWFPAPEEYRAAINRLSAKQRTKLVAMGLVGEDSQKLEMSDAGQGMEWDPVFLYSVKTSYFWKQRFPGKARVKIAHSYIPLKGSAFGPFGVAEGIALKDEMRSLDENGYCGSRSDFFVKPPSGEGLCRSHQSIDYILTTARTWKGPIGDFKLTLAGMRFVFTCFEGLKRTGLDTWDFSAKDFAPANEIKLAFCPTGSH